MARLGKAVTVPADRRWKWPVVLFWVIIMATVGGLASKVNDVQKNDASSWLPKSAESTRAVDLATATFTTKDAIDLAVLYVRDAGLAPGDRAKVQADQQSLRPLVLGGVTQVIPAGDGRALLLTGQMRTNAHDLSGFKKNVDDVKTVAHANTPPGLRVMVTGAAGQTGDFAEAFSGFSSTLLLSALAIVAVLLIISYRSPVLWIVPLMTAGMAAQIASGIVYLLARSDVITVNGQSAAILEVLSVGVGTDYALLLVSRYREELHGVEDRHRAMAVAVRRTFPAVLASAATVALAMLVLLVSELNSNRGLGPVLAIGVAVVFLMMMTFLPAVLVVLGRWVFWPFVPRHDDVTESEQRHRIWARIGAFVTNRSRPVWLITVVVLAGFAVASTTFEHGQQPNGGFTHRVESMDGLALLAQHYPAGATQPVEIYAPIDRADAVAAAARTVPSVAEIMPVRTIGQWAQIPAVLSVPVDSQQAYGAVESIRVAVHRVGGPDVLVGGATAVNLDMNHAAEHDQNLVMPLSLLLILVILSVLLRALLGPILLLASVGLSFYAAMGAAALVLRALGYIDISSGFFLGAFIFLVALGVDYTIFLTTRAREEVASLRDHTAGFRRAVVVTGGVITSAGLVLAGTFAVLGVLPLVFLLQTGIVVALGVLLDTFVVRTMVVPALAVDVGRRFWLPGRLARAPGREPEADEQPQLAPLSG